jgi:CheY-like chemotaxis protein
MPPRPFHIIAIDNDAALGQRLLTAFWGPEYAFHWFADGREALGALEELRPDVIVCELMLPGLHGRAVLEAVRLRPAFQVVPFLVLSSIRSDAIIDSMLEAGATAYLVKPFSVAQLKQTIRAVLENVSRPAQLDLAEDSRSAVPAAEPPSEQIEQRPLQVPVESPIAGDGRLAAPGEGETVRDSLARAGVDPASEPGPGTEDAPPPPVLAKGRRAKRARPRDRKRKSQDAAPNAPVPSIVPDDSAREPGEPAAATPAAAAGQLLEPSEPRVTSAAASGPSGIVSWGRMLRVAAALLAIGVMSDSQSRDPLPDGVTARTKHEPSDTPIDPSPPPAGQAPEAAEPAPEPSAEPALETPRPVLETPRPAPRNVDQMVRGRLQWAQSLYDDGRYDDARVALREVMKLAPTNVEARHLASQLERFATRLPGSVPSAPEEDERAVLALLWRYQTALEHRDVVSLDAIWPTADSDGLLARWKEAPPRPLALRLARLEVAGDHAVAMCVAYDDVAPADGDQPSSSSRVSFHLRRASGSWVIADVR